MSPTYWQQPRLNLLSLMKFTERALNFKVLSVKCSPLHFLSDVTEGKLWKVTKWHCILPQLAELNFLVRFNFSSWNVSVFMFNLFSNRYGNYLKLKTVLLWKHREGFLGGGAPGSCVVPSGPSTKKCLSLETRNMWKSWGVDKDLAQDNLATQLNRSSASFHLHILC